MNTEKRIGKINYAKLGFGGYKDAMFGLTVDIGSTKESWGVTSFKGYWSNDPDKYCKWTKQEQGKEFEAVMRLILKTLQDANKQELSKLKGVPVEVEFEGNTLKSWRVLTEAI